MNMNGERNEGHTTIRVSKRFRDYLAENAPKAQTYEEFITENLQFED